MTTLSDKIREAIRGCPPDAQTYLLREDKLFDFVERVALGLVTHYSNAERERCAKIAEEFFSKHCRGDADMREIIGESEWRKQNDPDTDTAMAIAILIRSGE